jgi:sugar lactone lactonase YvrE
MYWADTKAHTASICPGGAARPWASAQSSRSGRCATLRKSLDAYLGRPDGAAMDAEGCYWVAMFEGQRLLRLSPRGETLQTLVLPVRCPTMPCFGGEDLRTLFVTSARHGRPDEELALQPWAGAVLTLRVEVPGCPVPLLR